MGYTILSITELLTQGGLFLFLQSYFTDYTTANEVLFYLNWVAAFVHDSINAWRGTGWSCRLANHQITYKNTSSASLLPQYAWQPRQLLLLWLECGRDVTHSGSAGTTNSRFLTGKLSYIICNYSLWNSMPGKWALNESGCCCMWGICFPVTQTGFRHHAVSCQCS